MLFPVQPTPRPFFLFSFQSLLVWMGACDETREKESFETFSNPTAIASMCLKSCG